MMFLLLVIASLANAATVTDPETCIVFPCTIFEDEFDFLDTDVWEHEMTLGGGGNWEFQGYINNRSNTYTRESILYIRPTLLSDWQGEAFLSSGTFSVWGSQGRNDVCTGNFFYGCERVGNPTNILNPIISGRLRTLHLWSVRYGRVEIRAKLPVGDWLWPALWMMPENHRYGLWPASGEIDIMESRGNAPTGTVGNDHVGQTLHWGPYFDLNSFWRTTAETENPSGAGVAYGDDFHIFAVEWNDQGITMFVDGIQTAQFGPATGESWWEFGEFENVGAIDNPWASGTTMAPFDQPFYIIMNVAVGGTNGFFDDIAFPNKPWLNTSPTAFLDFWNARDQWYPGWTDDGLLTSRTSENAAMQIDYVRVTKQTSTEM